MNEAKEPIAGEGNVRRLSDAIREVKNAFADRDDVVVEMREVTRTRLELLAAELQDVAADAIERSPNFDFAVSAGETPRFWIEAVAHVALGRDRRTYRFLRDTQNGRVVLAKSTDIKPVSEAIVRYVAERIVERQRSLAGENVAALGAAAPTAAAVEPNTSSRGAGIFTGIAVLALGLIVGAAVTLFILRQRYPEISSLF